MKPLRTAFKYDGFDYKQVVREGNVAVFEQSKGSFRAWEVIRVGFIGTRVFGNVVLEASERYPRSEDWGTKAWTCMIKERAFQKMDELLVITNQKDTNER